MHTIHSFSVNSSVVFSIFNVVQIITIINFRAFSSPHKETLYPLAITSHFLPMSPALKIVLFWLFHINGVIKFVVFVAFFSLSVMFSKFVHFVVCISTSFIFTSKA